MYVEEVTIEGFKSYAQRVTLSNFDPCFNAITGLNGSGKSNILDSICFVLGISNLSKVRAGSLQELVYKQGQAGVTKATVSVTFRNDDPKRGPAGYEDKERITVTRQIVIGGRNKYLINGHAAQQSRVQDLFHSVQLNVNNPHFLIMQGFITKVLNMKPPEILSLLEEATGTMMYEKKKETALKTLEKKQAKLDEIDEVLNTTLLPALETMRQKCQDYFQYAHQSAQVEQLKKFVVAYDYFDCQRLVENGRSQLAMLTAAITEVDQTRSEFEAAIGNKSSEISALEAEKEIQAGGEVKELQTKVDQLSLKLAKDTAAQRNKSESLKSETASLTQVKESMAELLQADLEGRVTAATAARDLAKEAADAAEQAVENASRELAGAEAGDGRDESNKSMQERLADAQNAQTQAEADAKAADVRAKHAAKQLADLRKQLAAKGKEGEALQKELAKHQQALEAATQQLQALGYDEAAARELEATVEREQAAVQQCKEQVDTLGAQLTALNFSFETPERGFDRSRVKGVVARLLHVTDPANSLALEVAAGGKLYQVVVDSEATGKLLLERGRLRQRVTIVPLNKIRYHDTPRSVADAARRLVGNGAAPALELVGYAQELNAAMKYVFGGAFVCKDTGTAKKLAFSAEVATRSITLEGDDFNPSGLLTGGSRNSSGSVLTRLHALMEAEQRLGQHQELLQQAQAALRDMAGAAKEHQRLSREVELRQHSLQLARERVAGSEVQQLADGVAGAEGEQGAAQEAAAAARQRKAEAVEKAKSLEHEIANFSAVRDERIASAKAKQKAAKQQVEAKKKALKQKEQDLQAAVAERDASSGEQQRLQAQLAAAEEAVQALQGELQALSAALAASQAEVASATSRLESKRQRLAQCDGEIAELVREREGLQRQRQDCEVERRKREHTLKEFEVELQHCGERMKVLEKDYPWIRQEKAAFGRGDYDFSARDPKQAQRDYEEGLQTLDTLKKKGINKNAQSMFQQNEAECKALQEKRSIVQNDRSKISAVIEELDAKKRQALEVTWKKVDTDFNAIFSTLLPGTSARLVPPEGGTFLDGLEVRVAFGSVWKESLTELSGGQRSLLALALILALCRFRPAPIYILDEVDAALDLSHTQNVGAMIRQHFPQSQFIIVSLKEGMFNNASVIFRTKFVDGVSNVMRTANDRREKEGRENQARDKEARALQAAARGNPSRPALRENTNV